MPRKGASKSKTVLTKQENGEKKDSTNGVGQEDAKRNNSCKKECSEETLSNRGQKVRKVFPDDEHDDKSMKNDEGVEMEEQDEKNDNKRLGLKKKENKNECNEEKSIAAGKKLKEKDNTKNGHNTIDMTHKTSNRKGKRARKDSIEKVDSEDSESDLPIISLITVPADIVNKGRKRIKQSSVEELEETMSNSKSLKGSDELKSILDSNSKQDKMEVDQEVPKESNERKQKDKTDGTETNVNTKQPAKHGKKKPVKTSNIVIRERRNRGGKSQIIEAEKSEATHKDKAAFSSGSSNKHLAKETILDHFTAAPSRDFQPKVIISRNKDLDDLAEKESKVGSTEKEKSEKVTKNQGRSETVAILPRNDSSDNLNTSEDISKPSKRLKSKKPVKSTEKKENARPAKLQKISPSQSPPTENKIHLIDEDFKNESIDKKGRKWNFKIASWNINGIRAWLGKDGLSYLNKEQPDVLCLQETKCSEEKLPAEVHVKGYHCHFLAGDKDGYSGVGLLSKEKPISVKNGIGIEKHDTEGRVITAEYKEFYLVAAYVPNAGRGLTRLEYRMQWDKDFLQYLKKLDSKKPIILTGDLNVAHKEIDLANPKTNKKSAGFSQEERDGFTALLSEDLVDSFRHLYPEQNGAYTFWTYMSHAREKNVGWRLDYFVLSERYLDHLCDCVIRSKVLGSDHCPIVLFLRK